MNTSKNDTLDLPLSAPNYLTKLFDGQNSLVVVPRWLQIVAFICLCVYVYTWYLFNDFAGPFSAILVLSGTYLFWKKNHNTAIWKDPIILLLLAAITVQVASWLLTSVSHPDLVDSGPKIHRMGIWFKMIPIAIILGGRTDRVLVCWLLAVAALLSASILNGSWDIWRAGLAGTMRVDFGINNAQHTALLGGTILLSLLATFTVNSKLSWSKRCCLYALLTCALCFCLILVILTQTRAVWASLVISIPVLLIAMSIISKQSWRSQAIKSLVGLVLIAAFFVTFQDIFTQRANTLAKHFQSTETISEILLKDRSFFLRFATWQESIEWIKQKPVFGWGGAIEKHIVASTEKNLEYKIGFRHLHNSYLETLANYGIVGLTTLLLLCFYLGFIAHKCWRSGVMPAPVYLFLLSFLPFWLIANAAESFFYYSSGEYLLAIIGGVILSYYWKQTPEIHTS